MEGNRMHVEIDSFSNIITSHLIKKINNDKRNKIRDHVHIPDQENP